MDLLLLLKILSLLAGIAVLVLLGCKITRVACTFWTACKIAVGCMFIGYAVNRLPHSGRVSDLIGELVLSVTSVFLIRQLTKAPIGRAVVIWLFPFFGIMLGFILYMFLVVEPVFQRVIEHIRIHENVKHLLQAADASYAQTGQSHASYADLKGPDLPPPKGEFGERYPAEFLKGKGLDVILGDGTVLHYDDKGVEGDGTVLHYDDKGVDRVPSP